MSKFISFFLAVFLFFSINTSSAQNLTTQELQIVDMISCQIKYDVALHYYDIYKAMASQEQKVLLPKTEVKIKTIKEYADKNFDILALMIDIRSSEDPNIIANVTRAYDTGFRFSLLNNSSEQSEFDEIFTKLMLEVDECSKLISS